MNEHCRGCIRYLKSCSGMSKAVCEKHKLRIPRTNADRIRAMSDEELADAFIELFAAFYVIEWSRETLLNWLRQEATE